MQNEVSNRTVAKTSPNGLLQDQEAVLTSVQNIDASIAKNKEQLKTELNALEKAKANIEINRHWYGTVDIDTICKSLNNIYDDLRSYIRLCGSALHATNENMSRTLGLIRLLAVIEKDMYEKLDNDSIQGNVLKELIRDWCEKNNIRDEEVTQLLEASFQRAYTLRDRINDIRAEVRNKFGYYDTELEKLSANIESLKSDITAEKEKALKELLNLYTEKESMLDKFSTEKKNELARQHEQFVQVSNDLFHAIEAKANEISELKKQVETDNKSTQARTKEQIESFEVTLQKMIENQKKEHDSMMVSQQKMLSEAMEKTTGAAKRWAIGGMIIGAGLATAISFIVSMLL